MHDRRSHPPEIQRKKNEGGTVRCSSWPCRIFLAARAMIELFQPPRFYRGAVVHHRRRRLVNLIMLTASLVIVISWRKCGLCDANRRRRNAIHPVHAWRDGGCLHRRRRATAAAWRWRHGTARRWRRRRRVEPWRSVTRLFTTYSRLHVQCTRQWRNRLALRYVVWWECVGVLCCVRLPREQA